MAYDITPRTVRGANVPTMATALLFSSSPRDVLPQAGLEMARFRGAVPDEFLDKASADRSGSYMKYPLIFCVNIFPHVRVSPDAAEKNDSHTRNEHSASS